MEAKGHLHVLAYLPKGKNSPAPLA